MLKKCHACKRMKDINNCFDLDYAGNPRKCCKKCLMDQRERYHAIKETKTWGSKANQTTVEEKPDLSIPTSNKLNALCICPICLKNMEPYRSYFTCNIHFICDDCHYTAIYDQKDFLVRDFSALKPITESRFMGDIKFENDRDLNNTLVYSNSDLIKTIEPRMNILKMSLDKLKLYSLFS